MTTTSRWHPHWHVLDLRSLALFRILLGIYVLYDIFSRLKLGRHDIAWYTSYSSNVDTSFLASDDSPHRSPIHRIWFYRGSPQFQYAIFALTGVVDILFLVGWNNIMTKPLLWCLVVSYQHRNMFVHDGSDNFLRQLLLWSCFLPLQQRWSLQAYMKKQSPPPPSSSSSTPTITKNGSTVSSLACAGLTFQIVFMYWGTVWHRTLDLYPLSQLHMSEWMPSSLTAVHYVVAGSFATRSNPLVDLIRQTPNMSRIMTFMAMIGEFGAPLACLLLPISYRHYPALLLFFLHMNLLLVLNLPNWQFLGMLAAVVWIPPSVWDGSRLFRGDLYPHDIYKKTDGDDNGDATPSSPSKPKRQIGAGRILCYALFSYMIYNWCGERGWVQKHDGGDIGELFRISQHWVMYATLAHTASATLAIATTERVGETAQRWDVQSGIRTGRWIPLKEDDYQHLRHKSTIITDSSDRSVSPRWERALDQWSSRRDTTRAQRFCTALCRLLNSSSSSSPSSNINRRGRVTTMELIWKYYDVLPPGSSERYQPRQDNIYLQVNCPK